MITEPLFVAARSSEEVLVSFTFDGQQMQAPAGINVATALLLSGVREFRLSVVGQKPRAPYCMMGVCFECLVEIDDRPARQSCLVPLTEGMQIRRQLGASSIEPDTLETGDV